MFVGEAVARTGDDAGGRPTKARGCAAEPRWGRRKACGLLPSQDAAPGPLGAFLGMPAVESSPVSPPRAAVMGIGTR
jgi:hypothetical protein